MTMTAGVEVMVPVAREENMIPVVDATTTSTATEMAVIDMGDTVVVGTGSTIDMVEIGTGDMMDATMLDLTIIIITTTARADILTTVGVKKEGAGGETSRGGDDGVDPENGEKGGDGVVRVLEVTIAAANAGIVVGGAGADHGADHGADRGVDRAVHRRAEAGVEVWTVLIVRFVLPRISRRRLVAGAVRALSHDPDRVHRTALVGADLGAIAKAGVVPEQVAAGVEAGTCKVTIVHCHLLTST